MKVGHSHWPEMGQSEQYWDKSKWIKMLETHWASWKGPTKPTPTFEKFKHCYRLKKKKKRTVSQENRIVGERMSVFIEVFS